MLFLLMFTIDHFVFLCSFTVGFTPTAVVVKHAGLARIDRLPVAAITTPVSIEGSAASTFRLFFGFLSFTIEFLNFIFSRFFGVKFKGHTFFSDVNGVCLEPIGKALPRFYT